MPPLSNLYNIVVQIINMSKKLDLNLGLIQYLSYIAYLHDHHNRHDGRMTSNVTNSPSFIQSNES